MNHMLYIDEGISAHEAGERQSANPYIPGSDAHQWWLDGWQFSASRAEQLELISNT